MRQATPTAPRGSPDRNPYTAGMRWITHGERSVYESPWLGVGLVDVEIPGHRRFEHHAIRVPRPAAGVIMHEPDRGVLLLWRHRFITDTWGWEIPAGRIEAGETLEQGAARARRSRRPAGRRERCDSSPTSIPPTV